MKRLIMINILLVLLLSILPNEKLAIVKEVKEIAIEQVKTDVNRCEQISSRGSTDCRETAETATEISQNCIDFIKRYEDFREVSYKCPSGQWTIGYGHTADVTENQTITKEQAEKLLIADLKGFNDLVVNHCEYLKLNQNELDALVSFTYNCGYGNLKKLTANGTRNKQEIADHIEAYSNGGGVKLNGLQKRRAEEKSMFEGNI